MLYTLKRIEQIEFTLLLLASGTIIFLKIGSFIVNNAWSRLRMTFECTFSFTSCFKIVLRVTIYVLRRIHVDNLKQVFILSL